MMPSQKWPLWRKVRLAAIVLAHYPFVWRHARQTGVRIDDEMGGRAMLGSMGGGGGPATGKPTDPEVLKVVYSLTHPVEVHSFTNSLEALADLHRIQALQRDEDARDVRLFIREIRHGSIEVDLIEMAKTAGGALAPVVTQTHTVMETLDRVKKVFGWLRGDGKKPDDVSAKELELAKRTLAPVAENHGSTITMNVNNSPGAQIYVGSVEANAMQNQATRAIEVLREPEKKILTEVPLMWLQTDREGASSGRTGMRAIIEDVSDRPLPVYFPEAEQSDLKARMVSDVEFPYKKTFIVDIETIVVAGKLKGVKILRLHDTLDD